MLDLGLFMNSWQENLRDGVSATSHDLLAGLAAPDADGGATDSVLAAEGASVAGVLGHFLLCGVVSNLDE